MGEVMPTLSLDLGAFIPSAVETVLAPLLFAAAWYQPTA